MTDADIGFHPATDLLAQCRAKALSPVEAVEAILRHIGRQEPALNAMVRPSPSWTPRWSR